MITSKENSKVKQASLLLRYKKTRVESQQFVCDSKEAVLHILKHYPQSVSYVLYTSKAVGYVESFLSVHSDRCYEVSVELLSGISTLNHCFGVIVVCAIPVVEEKESDLALALCESNNPANLGAIIRSAYAFSCQQIYLLGDHCDAYHPESVRASAGHIFDVVITSCSYDYLSALQKKYDLFKLDASLGAQPLPEFQVRYPLLLVMGSEQGFPDLAILEGISSLSIPMQQGCDSLNVAVSASIALYACRHRHVSRETVA
jgi:TrmH family RNA methyltransferase